MSRHTHLTIEPDGITIDVREGETILQAMHGAGLGYRTGCRRGGCTVCKVDVVDGSVEHRQPIAASVMTPEEYGDGTCLTCKAVPSGDVVIRLRDERLRVKCRPLLDLRLVDSAERSTSAG